MILYRFRVWRSSDGEYRFDDDVYQGDIPEELVEEFHKPNEVYSIMASNTEDGKLILILSDNGQKLSDFVRGMGFGLNLESHFDVNRL